jgi:hypothetical protein
MFIDDEFPSKSREENEANRFATDTLLTSDQQERLARLPLTYRDVIRFAFDVGLSPGIVAGQLQHSKRAPYAWLNRAKRKLDWGELES